MTFGAFRLHDTAFSSRSTIASTGETQLRFAVCANVVERICQHHTLTQQLFCRLVGADQVACVTHQFMEEAEESRCMMACLMPPM